MTVCVAALCEDYKALVIATDQEVGLPYLRGQLGTQKARVLHRHWLMLLAGNDINPAYDVQHYAAVNFADVEEPIELDDAINCVVKAFKRKRLETAEALYLAPRGWTIDEFKKQGQSNMPLSLYLQIDSQIERNELEIVLLVAGFDDSGNGHIFSVHDPGIAVRHDAFGFYAIGSGGVNATTVLFQRQAKPAMKLWQALSCVFEGKAAGENAPGVGDKTNLWILTPPQKPGDNIRTNHFSQNTEKVLRDIWERSRPKIYSADDQKVLQSLKEVQTYESTRAKEKADKEAAEKQQNEQNSATA